MQDIPRITPLTRATSWLSSRPRAVQWAIIGASLVVVCACCTLGVGAISHPGGSDTGAVAPTAPAATHAPAKPAATATATHAPRWVTVQTFTGNGTGKSAPFQEDASQWRLVWKCDPRAYGFDYNLSVEVKSPTDPTVDDLAVNVICHDPTVTHGDTMEYTSGQLYLDVSSEASWTLTVQELR